MQNVILLFKEILKLLFLEGGLTNTNNSHPAQNPQTDKASIKVVRRKITPASINLPTTKGVFGYNQVISICQPRKM